jgi:hypothetical protein
MRNNVVKKLEGYMPYNRCMPTSVEAFFSGSHDTFKKGMPENNKELCEKYIRENHSSADIVPVKATIYYEIPETQTFCNKSKKCKEGICFCGELVERSLPARE